VDHLPLTPGGEPNLINTFMKKILLFLLLLPLIIECGRNLNHIWHSNAPNANAQVSGGDDGRTPGDSF